MPDTNRKPWYHKGLRFECRQCGNCCRTHGEYAFIYMMEEEVTAIAEHLGLPEAEFRTRYCTEEDSWTVVQTDLPACPFLGEDDRCTVYPVRPVQCRTWPFWNENLRQPIWEGPVRETCPGIGAGRLYSAEEVERIARENEAWYAGEWDDSV